MAKLVKVGKLDKADLEMSTTAAAALSQAQAVYQFVSNHIVKKYGLAANVTVDTDGSIMAPETETMEKEG